MVAVMSIPASFDADLQNCLGALPTGLDVGNGAVKLVAGSAETRIPSYFRLLHSELYDTSIDGLVEYLDGSRTDLIGKRWLGGQSAYEKDPLSVLRVTDDRIGKVQYALQLLLSALSGLPYQPDWKLAIAASIHDNQVFAQALNDALSGIHSVRFTQGISRVQVRVLKTLEEGQAALVQHRNQLSLDQQNVLLDVWNGTLIASLFGSKGVLLERRVFSGGVENLIAAIAKNLVLRKFLQGSQGDPHLIRKALESGSFEYGNTTFCFECVYRSEVKPWASAVLAPATRFIAPWQSGASGCLAIGGGLMLLGIPQALAAKGFITATEPAWSNARGLRKLAELLLQKEAK
jgi:hypothetical protein